MIVRLYFKQYQLKNNNLKQVQQKIQQIYQLSIKGIAGIEQADVATNIGRHVIMPDGSLQKVNKLFIATNGVNFREIYKLQYKIKDIQYELIHCDNIHEMNKRFGILAAKYKLEAELDSLYDDKSDFKHYSIVTQELTYQGKMTNLDRNGVEKRNNNLLLQMSNANPLKSIRQFSISEKKSQINGISPACLVTTLPFVGTGYNDIYVDVELTQKLIKEFEEKREQNPDFWN